MSWQCLESGTRKARKVHRCFFCGEQIQIGEKYNFRSGIADGVFTMKMHPECDEATKDWKEYDYESFSEGDLKRGQNEPK